jgi:hypothetical protein
MSGLKAVGLNWSRRNRKIAITPTFVEVATLRHYNPMKRVAVRIGSAAPKKTP